MKVTTSSIFLIVGILLTGCLKQPTVYQSLSLSSVPVISKKSAGIDIQLSKIFNSDQELKYIEIAENTYPLYGAVKKNIIYKNINFHSFSHDGKKYVWSYGHANHPYCVSGQSIEHYKNRLAQIESENAAKKHCDRHHATLHYTAEYKGQARLKGSNSKSHVVKLSLLWKLNCGRRCAENRTASCSEHISKERLIWINNDGEVVNIVGDGPLLADQS